MAHNHEVGGAIPSPATKKNTPDFWSIFLGGNFPYWEVWVVESVPVVPVVLLLVLSVQVIALATEFGTVNRST